MARPRKKIDPVQVEALARIHCTHKEIAIVVGCSTDTLVRRFADLIEKGREDGKASLRRAQFKSALDGNATMQIWLGKQHLEQHDKQRLEHSGPEGKPIEVNTNDVRERIASRIAGIAARIGPPSDPVGTHNN